MMQYVADQYTYSTRNRALLPKYDMVYLWITFDDDIVQGLVSNVNAIESMFWTKVRS